MAEEAVLRRVNPNVRKSCEAEAREQRDIDGGEVHRVRLTCPKKVRFYDVTLLEIEDAVCYVKKVRRAT